MSDTRTTIGNDRCSCGGRYDARTDGNGSVVDRCVKCDAKRGERGRAPLAVTVRPAAGAKCAVTGCPGTLDGQGKCQCCVKRQAFIEAHAPTKPCGICGGMIRVNRRQTMCKPCGKAKAQYAPSEKIAALSSAA